MVVPRRWVGGCCTDFGYGATSKFPTDLLQTANKILNGNKLLRWASSKKTDTTTPLESYLRDVCVILGAEIRCGARRSARENGRRGVENDVADQIAARARELADRQPVEARGRHRMLHGQCGSDV
eukprot:2163913-Rhodomonas_salina.2